MKSVAKKLALSLSSILVILIALVFYYKETKYSIVINKPIEDVWSYASNSNLANKWSVYFHHISPIGEIPDGQIGSVRRCFRQEDESGPRWDEEVMEVEFQKYRRLRTFNLVNFNNELFKEAEFKVHQRYEMISPSSTRLTFATELERPVSFEMIAALLPATDETKRIFRLNLENIKAHIEQGDTYKRIHAYESTNRFDSN